MAVTFNIEGGAQVTMPNSAVVQLNSGPKVVATDLQQNDVFIIREGDWAKISSSVVVT
jgi:hypothetical protein